MQIKPGPAYDHRLAERAVVYLQTNDPTLFPFTVRFDDVAFYIIPKQTSGALAPTKGQGIDHMGLSVSDLDATVAKLRSEGVKFLEQPHQWGATRAAMVEGPDQVSIEIVEVK